MRILYKSIQNYSSIEDNTFLKEMGMLNPVTGNSVHSNVAIPTKTGSYLRNKQVKSTFILLYENKQEGN